GAAISGLVGSAQSEHPDRGIVLIDVDAHERSRRALPQALAGGELQLAVRDGRGYAPRLAPMGAVADAPERSLNAEGTVLITGGTGALGAQVARHLVAKHGVRHLLLLSRKGRAAAGAEALLSELERAGAQVRLGSCDVADRAALARWIASVPAAHPLIGV